MSRPSVQTVSVPIETLEDGMARLTGGRFRAVLEVSSVNFALLSEPQQEAVIASFAACLNSVNFPLQFVIRVLPVDIEVYVSALEHRLRSERSARLLDLGRDHLAYVRRAARARTLLDRRFFVVVPVGDPEERTGLLRWFCGGKRQSELDEASARRQLSSRCDEVERQLTRVGVAVRRLQTVELVNLYFSGLCSELASRQRFRDELAGYTAPVVQAAHGEERAA